MPKTLVNHRRHDQREVRVDPVEVAEQGVERHDAHGVGDHERGQQGAEGDALAGKAQPRKGVGGQRAEEEAAEGVEWWRP